MRRLWPLLVAGSLMGACSDSKTDARDAGTASNDASDHNHNQEDAGESHAGPTGVDQPQGNLERPPGEKLPDALKPPGFAH